MPALAPLAFSPAGGAAVSVLPPPSSPCNCWFASTACASNRRRRDMNDTAEPDAWEAYLANQAAADAKEQAFREKYRDTYRRLAGNFTHAEQELLRSRAVASHARQAIAIAA